MVTTIHRSCPSTGLRSIPVHLPLPGRSSVPTVACCRMLGQLAGSSPWKTRFFGTASVRHSDGMPIHFVLKVSVTCLYSSSSKASVAFMRLKSTDQPSPPTQHCLDDALGSGPLPISKASSNESPRPCISPRVPSQVMPYAPNMTLSVGSSQSFGLSPLSSAGNTSRASI